MKAVATFLSLFLIALACLQCKPKENTVPEANQLSAAEISEGWELLFDGVSFNGWRNFNSDTLVGWVVDSGNLLALGQGGDHANDIITTREFENFELSLEWKTSIGGNSGIFFNAIEDTAIQAIY